MNLIHDHFNECGNSTATFSICLASSWICCKIAVFFILYEVFTSCSWTSESVSNSSISVSFSFACSMQRGSPRADGSCIEDDVSPSVSSSEAEVSLRLLTLWHRSIQAFILWRNASKTQAKILLSWTPSWFIWRSDCFSAITVSCEKQENCKLVRKSWNISCKFLPTFYTKGIFIQLLSWLSLMV